jgi:hypothetical protein
MVWTLQPKGVRKRWSWRWRSQIRIWRGGTRGTGLKRCCDEPGRLFRSFYRIVINFDLIAFAEIDIRFPRGVAALENPRIDDA